MVNTEEQNRAVNPGDSETQEDSISQEAAHTFAGESSDPEPQASEPDKKEDTAVNEMGENEIVRPRRIEGDDAGNIDRQFPEK